MSRLRVFSDSNPDATEINTTDAARIAGELSNIGVTFERWRASKPITPGATRLNRSATLGSGPGTMSFWLPASS